MSTVIAVSVFELHLPACRSLKEKRRVIKSLIERPHRRHRVSITESDFHELRQRAEITLALVASGEREAERILDRIRGLVDSHPEAELTFWEPQILGSSR